MTLQLKYYLSEALNNNKKDGCQWNVYTYISKYFYCKTIII